jgi:replicative DNA helicase
LVENSEHLTYKLNIISENFHLNEFKVNIKYLELPKLTELVELIINIKDKYDFFIVDELTFINNKINAIFSEKKNYQTIARHLKILCTELNKNIIILTNIDRKIEELKFSFSYYGIREKYFNSILILYRPSYYKITENEYCEKYEDGHSEIHVAKHQNNYSIHTEFALMFNLKKITLS